MTLLNRRSALAAMAAWTASGCAVVPRGSKQFVLVHGAWHAAWAWDQVAAELRSRGHQVDAIDLPGHGPDLARAGEVSLQDYADAVVRAIDARSGPVVVVAHSLGGIATTGAIEMRPDRVSTAVYVAAFLLPSQASLQDYSRSPANAGSLLTDNIVLSPDRKTTTLKPENLREVFYGDCSEDEARRAIARLTAEPLRPLIERQTVTSANFGRVKKLYVQCMQDRTVMPALQQKMYMDANVERVVQLPSSHSPMLSMPRRLADVLESA